MYANFSAKIYLYTHFGTLIKAHLKNSNNQVLFAKIMLAGQKDYSLNMGSEHLTSFMYLYSRPPVEKGSLLFPFFLVGTRNQIGYGVDSWENAGVRTLHHLTRALPNYLPSELGSPGYPFVLIFDSGMKWTCWMHSRASLAFLPALLHFPQTRTEP